MIDRTEPLAGAASRMDDAGIPLKRNELLLVFVFWTFIAVLIVANRLLDPRGGFRVVPSSASITLAFVESYIWALLTPPIFSLASRYSVERAGRVRRIALFLVLGVVVAFVVDASASIARSALLPPPPQRPPGAGGPPPGFQRGFGFGLPRLW